MQAERVTGQGARFCHGCGAESAPYMVRVGHAPREGSCTATLCPACVRQAFAIVERETTPQDHGYTGGPVSDGGMDPRNREVTP